jgi:aspartyl-tRNA(Asn)/glutamyl-tRNA(Gln) amidotransferase subunit B
VACTLAEAHEIVAAVRAECARRYVALREAGAIGPQAVDPLIGGLLAESGASTGGVDVKAIAEKLGLVVVRDEGQLNAWVDAAIAANEAAANDVRSGKMAAIGRIVGSVMKLSGGKVDAKSVNEAILKKLQG